MSKLFVFGIGGTGARVVRSLIFLLGAGVKCSASAVVPILIDPDSSNGDVNRTIDLVSTYKYIQSQMPNKKSGFFSTPLVSLGEAQKENQASSFFPFHLQKIQNTQFRDYISYHSLGETNKHLVDLLFSESNLNLEMQVGFKGNPNIGSVVLNQFKTSDDFKIFANQFEKGDKIFIISSIFGGTGASGFPLLLKNIRNAEKDIPNHALLREAKIGALSILPYFGLQQDEKSSISKESFLPKAKAALDYYEKYINHSLDSMYYIGDKSMKDYNNQEGQSLQKNDAHFIELASALGIIDFSEKEDSQLQRGSLFYEFGIKNDAEELTFDDLGKRSRDSLLSPLSSYLFFVKYLELKMTHSVFRKQTWTQEGTYKFDENFLSSPFYKTYISGFNSNFIQWLVELSRNKRAFTPFHLSVTDKNLFKLIHGLHEKKGFLHKKKFDAFDTELNSYVRKIPNDMNKESKFMILFENAIQNLLYVKYEIGRNHG
jgi:hypothetical protein